MHTDLVTTVFLSLRMALAATILNVPLALAVVYLLTRRQFAGRAILDGMVNLPLVMPPVTTGYLLLLLLGRRGIIGGFLFSTLGIRIAFTSAAAVIASMVVSFPLVTRSIRISMDMLDRRLETAAQTLGADRFQVFIRVTLPQILPGVVNGMVLGFARCLGEFGATMTFAGNIQGETRTIPLSVYSSLQVPGGEKDAGFLVLVSIVISFLAMYASSRFTGGAGKGRADRYEPAI